MKDRIPKYKGRVLITPEDGSKPFHATVARADEPLEVGTPLNKATLLSDDTVKEYRIDNLPDPTPNDAFNNIYKVGDFKITSRSDLSDKWLKCNGDVLKKSDYPALDAVSDDYPYFNYTLSQNLIMSTTPTGFKPSDFNYSDTSDEIKGMEIITVCGACFYGTEGLAIAVKLGAQVGSKTSTGYTIRYAIAIFFLNNGFRNFNGDISTLPHIKSIISIGDMAANRNAILKYYDNNILLITGRSGSSNSIAGNLGTLYTITNVTTLTSNSTWNNEKKITLNANTYGMSVRDFVQLENGNYVLLYSEYGSSSVENRLKAYLLTDLTSDVVLDSSSVKTLDSTYAAYVDVIQVIHNSIVYHTHDNNEYGHIGMYNFESSTNISKSYNHALYNAALFVEMDKTFFDKNIYILTYELQTGSSYNTLLYTLFYSDGNVLMCLNAENNWINLKDAPSKFPYTTVHLGKDDFNANISTNIYGGFINNNTIYTILSIYMNQQSNKIITKMDGEFKELIDYDKMTHTIIGMSNLSASPFNSTHSRKILNNDNFSVNNTAITKFFQYMKLPELNSKTTYKNTGDYWIKVKE